MTHLPDAFYVMAERCGECLYGPDKIVSNGRRKGILQGLVERDNFFICHKASIAGVTVACRGDFERRDCGLVGRIAQALDAVRPVTEDEFHTVPPQKEYDDEC